MKRSVAIILCAVMLLTALAGCTTLEKNDEGEYDKGAIIPMYLGTQMYNFDPQAPYLNDSNIQILDLLFVGLTDIDAKGKLQMTLIDKYEIVENEALKEYKMKITLKHSKWSDGVDITASDVVYAWKRIIKATYQSEAACLLYDIKNARDVKLGYKSVDDFGATAPETYVVEIEFERKIDYTQFLRNLSSPALVPLRESVVGKSADWARKSATIVTSGPFTLKVVTLDGLMRLERSNNYFLDKEKDKYLDKYVIPYRLETDYSKSLASYVTNLTSNVATDRTFYTNEIPLDMRADYRDAVTLEDEMSTHTYYFNTNNKLFSDAKVRKALSLAIDREHVANDIVVYAKPATGFVPYKVTNGSVGSSFRDAGGSLIDTKANMDEAKKLLSEAGVSGGTIRIAYKAGDEVSEAVANYVKDVWAELGFSTAAIPYAAKENDTDNAMSDDAYAALYSIEKAQSADTSWDVMALDYQMLSEEAFSALAPFALEFSGNGANMNDIENDYPAYGHITGYRSEEYDKLIEEAFEELDPAKRAEKLHDAEELLMEDMPIMPIIFNQKAYTTDSTVVSGFSSDYYTSTNFNRVEMKNYYDWKKAMGY